MCQQCHSGNWNEKKSTPLITNFHWYRIYILRIVKSQFPDIFVNLNYRNCQDSNYTETDPIGAFPFHRLHEKQTRFMRKTEKIIVSKFLSLKCILCISLTYNYSKKYKRQYNDLQKLK